MQKMIAFFLLIFISLSINSTAQTPLRIRIDFDENWKFHLGNAADPLKFFNYSIANIFAKFTAKTGAAIDGNFKDSDW